MVTSEILFKAETELLENVLANLKKGTDIKKTKWKTAKLKELGVLNKDNTKILNKYKQAILNGSADEISATGKEVLASVDAQYKKAIKAGADFTTPKNTKNADKITSLFVGQNTKDMNYTMQSLLNGSKAIYKDTITKASYKVLHGGLSIDDAVKETCKKWINAGSIAIKDASGREWSPESYSRMILRTNNRQVTTKLQLQRNKDYGNNLIEISSHAGARELCAPYQGKILCTDGKNKDYQSLSSTSYGEPAGLFGINCRHDSYPYFEGLSKKTFEESPFDEKVYNETQEQRRNETAIRNAKRKIALNKKNGTSTVLAEKTLADAEKAQKAFIKKTGRTRYTNRENL